MSLNTISIPNTDTSLERSIEQIRDNFRHLSVLWDSTNSAASSGDWTRGAWSSLQSGLKSQLVNLIGSTGISNNLVWPQYIYYIASGNQFESLVPFEVHSTASVKNQVSNNSATDHCWIIYLDSSKKLQKVICNPFLVNGIGLSGNALKWTYDGQDTGIFVSGPPSASKSVSTHLYIARVLYDYHDGGKVSGIPTGIENQTQLELSSRGNYSPSTDSKSHDSRRVELIGISDISGIESGSPVLVLGYAQSNKNATRIWLSTLRKSGSTLYAYCGESNMISAHHTTSGLTELVSKSNSSNPVSFLSFGDKSLKIYSNNNSLIIDLAQITLNIEYPVIITRNRDQYNTNVIDTSEPLLSVDASVVAQRGVIIKGTSDNTSWGYSAYPINHKDSILTVNSINTLRNTHVTGRDWILNYMKRQNSWLEGYYMFVTDEYPQTTAPTQYVNNNEFTYKQSKYPCKAIMSNGIAARTGYTKIANGLIYNSAIGADNYNDFYQYFFRQPFDDINSNDSTVGYGSIFGVYMNMMDAEASELIRGEMWAYCVSLYGQDNLRNINGSSSPLCNLSPSAISQLRDICEDYDRLFIINTSALNGLLSNAN